MGFYLTIVLLLGVAVTAVMGRMNGAPPEACSTITPNHSPNTPSGDAVPYIVNISSLADGYVPGYNYTIVLSGTTTNPDFRGFLLQGRVMADDTATGTFTDNGDDQQLVCDGDTSVTHVNNTEKTTVQLVWYPPPMGTGPILFRYAFVDMFTLFWANQTTDIVYEVTNVVNETTISPTMTTPTPTNTTTDGMMTSSSAIIATSTTPSGTPDGGGATGVMAASSVMIMLLASIIALIN